MQLPPGFRFSIEDAPSREDLRYLNDVLDKMNEPFFAGTAFGRVGTTLMREAERVAVERGCHSAFLDTFSFQAPGFYQKLGYEIFATLDYPPRHKRHFLKRRLVAE